MRQAVAARSADRVSEKSSTTIVCRSTGATTSITPLTPPTMTTAATSRRKGRLPMGSPSVAARDAQDRVGDELLT